MIRSLWVSEALRLAQEADDLEAKLRVLRAAVTEALDAEIGDDVPALRRLLFDALERSDAALSEPGQGKGAAVRIGSPQGQSHGPDATPGSLSGDVAAIRYALELTDRKTDAHRAAWAALDRISDVQLAREVFCGCRSRCGDDGDTDGPGTCKGLPRPPKEPLVEVVLEHRGAMRHALYGALHRLGLWTPDGGIEIPEELSAQLDIPLEDARALQPLFPPAAASDRPCPDCGAVNCEGTPDSELWTPAGGGTDG